MKNDHRSKFSNLSNWKEEAWKKSGLQRDSNPWPPRCRCVAPPTELWSHTLGARSVYWVHISREEWNDVKYIWNNVSFVFYLSLQLSVALFPVELRWPAAYFLLFSVFLVLFFFCLSLYSKIVNMTINLSLILWQHGCRNNFRSRLYWLFSCLCFTRRGWVCDFKPK